MSTMEKGEREREIVLTDILKNLPGDIKITKSFNNHIRRYMTCDNDEKDDTQSIIDTLYESESSEPLVEIRKIDLRAYLEKRLSDFCWCENFEKMYSNCCGKKDLQELVQYLENENCIKH